jgi:hypothetical protein
VKGEGGLDSGKYGIIALKEYYENMSSLNIHATNLKNECLSYEILKFYTFGFNHPVFDPVYIE